MNAKELITIAQFLHDGQQNMNIMTQEQSDKIEALWNQYKKCTVEPTDVVICCEAGKYGNLAIRTVKEIDEPTTLKYEPGSYDYISIRSIDDYNILWTDDSTTEPYNRQSPLYIGARWSNMTLIDTTPEYREFHTSKYSSNITFGVWGYSHNNYWNSVKFGICVKAEDADQFIKELRVLLNK